MKIQAAVLEQVGGTFNIRDITLEDVLRPNEVLVKIVATGLCHTDISVRDQHIPIKLPAVLGHEGSGIVVNTGLNVSKVKAGDKVVLAPSSCGKCSFCLSGHPSYCKDLIFLNAAGCRADGSHPYHDVDGNDISSFFFGQSSFATYSLTTENNVVKVGDDVPLEILGPLGCGMQTGAGTVLNVLKPSAGESIVIFGVGPVGLAALMAAKAAGCTIIVAVDVHDNRLKLATALGATHVINSKGQIPSGLILKNIRPGGVHYAVDTTGRSDVINQALASLRPMGKCALVGIPSVSKLEIDYSVFGSGKSIEYVFEGDSVPDVFIPRLIEMYTNGLFPFDELVKFYGFEDINQAVADSESGATLKAIIRMPD